MLLLLPVDATQSVTGSAGFKWLGRMGWTATSGINRNWRRTHTPTMPGPVAADGHHIVNGWVARLPVDA